MHMCGDTNAFSFHILKKDLLKITKQRPPMHTETFITAGERERLSHSQEEITHKPVIPLTPQSPATDLDKGWR